MLAAGLTFPIAAGADSKPAPEASALRPLTPGDHVRKLTVGNFGRNYLVHVPSQYDPKKPTAVVLVLHGAGTNGRLTVPFTGMSEKSDQAGFIAVYPNGTGAADLFLTWNAGGLPASMTQGKPDDVAFIRSLLADLKTVVNVDPKHLHVTGMSNGGMMCYKLAAELSDIIASIAPVAGTMTMDDPRPTRPVPVLHFHGTADNLVPFGGPGDRSPRGMGFKSVEQTIRAWCNIDRCPETPQVENLPDKFADDTTVIRKTYGPGKNGTEVILVEITGGGHTWPGQAPLVGFIGRSTQDISANDLIWDFFQKHALKF